MESVAGGMSQNGKRLTQIVLYASGLPGIVAPGTIVLEMPAIDNAGGRSEDRTR
jgi:hypothetical protein